VVRQDRDGMEEVKKDGGGGGGEGKGEEGKGEEKKKVRRPSKAESLMRERANSMPLMESFKRGEKRKERQEELEMKEGEVFKKSGLIKRSPERQEIGGLKEILEEMREGFREMKTEIRENREGREEMRRWIEEMWEKWERENEGLRKRLEELEKRMEEMEKRGGEERGKEEKEGNKGKKVEQLSVKSKGEIKELEERMRRLEMEGEKRDREERKRNIIIKGVRVKEEGMEGLRKEIKEIVEVTGAKAKVEGIRRLGKKDKEGGEIIWVRFASVGEKVEVMKGKAKLRDRREWILDDLTVRERRIDWWIKNEAERIRREGKKVKIGYMKMWIEGKLWIWDEIKDELREWQERGIGEEKGGKDGKGVGKGKEVF